MMTGDTDEAHQMRLSRIKRFLSFSLSSLLIVTTVLRAAGVKVGRGGAAEENGCVGEGRAGNGQVRLRI